MAYFLFYVFICISVLFISTYIMVMRDKEGFAGNVAEVKKTNENDETIYAKGENGGYVQIYNTHQKMQILPIFYKPGSFAHAASIADRLPTYKESILLSKLGLDFGKQNRL